MAYVLTKGATALSSLSLPPFFADILRKFKILPPLTDTPLLASDTLWLYDNVAYPSSESPSGWYAEFIAAYFAANTGKDVSKVVADICEKLGLAHGDAAEKRVEERVQTFMDIVVQGRTVEVDFAAQGRVMLGPSSAGGISINNLALPGGPYRDGEEVISTAILPEGSNERKSLATMKTRFAGKTGWGVVSDIDDTIKVTMVRDRIELLKHTFALEPEAVAGTPALYERLNAALQPAWFYLSASPYNLYTMLAKFVHENYPQGQILLREMSWQELEGFIVSLTVGTQKYKEGELERLVKHLPERKWVFIGDSTQTDPESYATTYRKFPNAVKRIFIRVVEGVNRLEERRLNSKERFEKAFNGVPTTVWRTYKDPSELDRLVAEIA
ncbi:hypothetical protein FN846DRAFT_960185 [Sphaerosporella brunnea]|uniref:Phosphatidate phosphatase APP1 catalytic domain-containing protein n=1 Tax=Sphaerosporella brunnea TaxID=1250544 RepID=A0A5J5ERJ6_9PEZI|nr:hypothetical protein FN846DRAFT_960185 [Sphaerosporella brunnea]